MQKTSEKYILVTGATGQLGFDIVKELKNKQIPVIGVGSSDLDITNAKELEKYFETHSLSQVIHCAAYTKVDAAEDEKELNYKINVKGTENIVSQCYKYNLPLTYFSTDYVFGGEGNTPFKEDDSVNPLCEYARAKYEGEEIVKKLTEYFIIRISWVFGKNGNNFVKTMLKLALTKSELSIVSDQIGSPTYTVDVAKEILEIINTKKYGIYHVTNEGFVSWADFAREIFKLKNLNVNVIDILSKDYASKAKRPLNSRLDKSKLYENGFSKMPTWQDALKRYLVEIDN